MKDGHRQLDDVRRLHEAWVLSFDRSRCQSLFSDAVCRRDGEGLVLLGEGRHFRSYRIEGQSLPGRPVVDLVIKRANDYFPRSGTVGRRTWLEAMTSLATRRDLPLVPPFALLGDSGNGAEKELGIAMPFGPDDKSKAALHWPPAGDWERILAESLASLGLRLEDQLQTRVWNGVPFVIDLSDLRR